MQYFSTNKKSSLVSFREAVLNGQPPDKGLYFPAIIPPINNLSLRDKSKAETAFAVIHPFVGNTIADEQLFEICQNAVNFDFPLVKITDDIYALELFHGATLAFKDVGARFMSGCLQHFTQEKKEKTIVIVATSGDTGGAVAAGFLGAKNVEVVILYPSGKVSNVQELQLTTLGQNITALEVTGTFDDCQTLAKTALADDDIKQQVFLTSANSINVARWLPQQFYYFYALQKWQEKTAPVISVPSGNFGNICAGLLAQSGGLPIKHFIAATNANDVVPRFLESGDMQTKSSVATLSNAMDVANPSNFARILEMFGGNIEKLKSQMLSISVTDETTARTMREVYQKYNYILDPHGAVGFYALQQHLLKNPKEKGIFLATAHPVKFDSVTEILGTFGEIPRAIKELLSRPKQTIEIKANYIDLKEILLSKI
ncbi:MAG: threonine synthase [Pyrinomonadaceae bacterium]